MEESNGEGWWQENFDGGSNEIGETVFLGIGRTCNEGVQKSRWLDGYGATNEPTGNNNSHAQEEWMNTVLRTSQLLVIMIMIIIIITITTIMFSRSGRKL